jgi:hypothetical protein
MQRPFDFFLRLFNQNQKFMIDIGQKMSRSRRTRVAMLGKPLPLPQFSGRTVLWFQLFFFFFDYTDRSERTSLLNSSSSGKEQVIEVGSNLTITCALNTAGSYAPQLRLVVPDNSKKVEIGIIRTDMKLYWK